MDPRHEAYERLGGRYEVRVLEPSPPAVTQPPYFADDPAARGEVADGWQVVTPTTAGDLTWSELSADDAELAAWCAERWLAAWPRLGPLPAELVDTREALHAVAEHVLAAARYGANGKVGLRWTRGGLGTPFFGDDNQVRIQGDQLVVQGRRLRRGRLTTLRAAGELAGIEPGAPAEVYAPTTPLDLDAELQVDPEAAWFLGDWFGLAASVLEQLRAESAPRDDASRAQLWPEHLDLAVELGAEGRRASFGASPGDAEHPQPYFYVLPWQAPAADAFWNDAVFGGASLAYAALQAQTDQRGGALAFLRGGVELLRQS